MRIGWRLVQATIPVVSFAVVVILSFFPDGAGSMQLPAREPGNAAEWISELSRADALLVDAKSESGSILVAAAATASNVIDFRLNPSYLSGWEIFHLTDAQHALTPFPALYWPGGGNVPAGSYPYQSLSGGVGGYRGIRYDALSGGGVAKSDTGVWTNAGATRYFCARKRIQLTGAPRNSVTVSISGHVDDDFQLFVRSASGQVTPLFRDGPSANNFSGSVTFSTLQAGTNWVEVYATDAVFSGGSSKRHLFIAMSPVAVPVTP